MKWNGYEWMKWELNVIVLKMNDNGNGWTDGNGTGNGIPNPVIHKIRMDDEYGNDKWELMKMYENGSGNDWMGSDEWKWERVYGNGIECNEWNVMKWNGNEMKWMKMNGWMEWNGMKWMNGMDERMNGNEWDEWMGTNGNENEWEPMKMEMGIGMKWKWNEMVIKMEWKENWMIEWMDERN